MSKRKPNWKPDRLRAPSGILRRPPADNARMGEALDALHGAWQDESEDLVVRIGCLLAKATLSAALMERQVADVLAELVGSPEKGEQMREIAADLGLTL